MATAVTLTPTAPLDGPYQKRKRSQSRSPENDDQPPATRRRSVSPPPKSRLVGLPKVNDVDPVRRAERERQLAARMAANELEKLEKEKEKEKNGQEFDAKAEFAKLTSTRSGGVYLPPARLRAMQEAASKDKASSEYQRLSWDALRKSITGIVNRVNIANIKHVVPELLEENLIRGRGLFARSIMKAQAASLPFTPVFAALVAIINTKLPQVGELVLTRLISQFRRAFKRNDKIVCHSTTTFMAHLVNQGVAHEIIALQILVLLLERPTDDSIEIAVGFTREVGAFLAENSPKANATVFERFRAVLNEGTISHRVQYMIEVLMQVRKDKYKDNPIVPEGLNLVEEDDQITHQIQLEEELQVQEGLNIFKFDPNYIENEERYKAIKAEILGEGSSEEESGSEESSDEDEEVVGEKEGIQDRTETNLLNLRRVIYLTIMNALNYEEAVHKLHKVQLKEGEEIELCNMIIECCSQERSYSTFYGLIGERFCKLNRVWYDCFQEAFGNYYTTIHRYETNRLRNIARFFGHLLATDSISWTVMECIKLTEDDTTSSSRIFIKIMLNEVTEAMGLKILVERFKDDEVKSACRGMFPMDNPKDTRFAINYFTSIGLGAVTEEMREHLKNAPRIIMEQRRAMLEAESSSSDSSESDDDDDSSESDSDPSSSSDTNDDTESNYSRRSGRRRRSPSPPRRDRGRGRDDSRAPPRRDYGRGRDDSRTPYRDKRVSPSPPPPSRYRNEGRDMDRDRYRPRHDSPPHRRDYVPDGRNRVHARSPPPSPSPPPRSRYDSPRRRSRSRSLPRRDKERDLRRPRDDYDRRRDDSRDRMRERDYPRDRRRASTSRERYGRDPRR
ncbi:pre-mRNA-splicing factor cwc22 [Taiwanofungus camphoratus]|nr:pre-mRNA-splicing factor cwc22 [Antrodia cinnamomea]